MASKGKFAEKLSKVMALIARVALGVTFVFSGFTKAVDPQGTAYKIGDYLQAFEWSFLNEYATLAAILLITFEMCLGLMLLLGMYRRRVNLLTLLFVAVLTGLTLYVAIANPVSDCGCFGDAIHLTNRQTFEKNIILLLLSCLLVLYRGPLYEVYGPHTTGWAFALSLLIPLSLMFFSNRHLPQIDFRPYKTGKSIPEQMTLPDGLDRDSVQMVYIYEKNGVQQRFSLDDCPFDDKTWQFVDREETVIREAQLPPVHDFNLMHPERGDISEEILSDSGYTFLIVTPLLDGTHRRALPALLQLQEYAAKGHASLYWLTASSESQIREWRFEYDLNMDFCTVDETVLKTMVRSNPGLLLLKDGVVYQKWSAHDIPQVQKYLDRPLADSDLARPQLRHEARHVLRIVLTAFVGYLFILSFRVLKILYRYRKRKKQITDQ